MNSFGEIISAAGTQSKEAHVDALIAALPPIYQKQQDGTIIKRLYEALAEELVKADITIESVGHNNYLSVAVTDEFIIRSSDKYDRLANENAFELNEVRFTPPGTLASQTTRLVEGENQVQLFFVPKDDIDFIISDVRDTTLTPTNFPTSFNSITNILTVIANREGTFTINYLDTGNVIRLNENATIPEGLFRLGWSEGGWSELGFGE